jgi:hypothetical protein
MSDSNELPRQFRPTMLRVFLRDGGDKKSYAHGLLSRASNAYPNAFLNAFSEHAAKLEVLNLPDPVRDLQRFDDATKRVLWGQMNTLDGLMRKCFDSAADPITKSWTTWLPPSPDTGDPGVVVWVRETRTGVAQFILSDLRVDPQTGNVSVRSSPALQRTPSATIQPLAAVSEKEILGDVVDVASSVSWALPPPWGAITTGGLAVFKILLGSMHDDKPSPLDALRKGLEEFIKQDHLREYAADFHAYTMALNSKIAGLNIKADEIADQGADYFDDLKDWLRGAWGWERVHNRCIQLYELLVREDIKEQADLDRIKQELDLYVTGVTLWITGRKIHMQILAAEAGRADKLKDGAAFLDKTRSWLSEHREIRNMIMGIADGDPDLAEGYFQQASKQIDGLSTKRLQKISDVHAHRGGYAGSIPVPGTGGSVMLEGSGWTFVDSVRNDDEDTHYIMDTYEDDPCSRKTISSKPQVEKNRDGYVRQTASEIDGMVKKARETVTGWKSSLDLFATLLPPPAPHKAPTVTALKGGSPTPQGTRWVKGNKVQYAVGLKNEKGPSDAGPWSTALMIGDTAFAQVSLPDPPAGFEACTQLVYRRVYADSPDHDTQVLTVAIAQPGQKSIEDMKT